MKRVSFVLNGFTLSLEANEAQVRIIAQGEDLDTDRPSELNGWYSTEEAREIAVALVEFADSIDEKPLEPCPCRREGCDGTRDHCIERMR